jgi:hypothetical protein
LKTKWRFAAMKRRELVSVIRRLCESIDAIDNKWTSGDLAGAVHDACAVRDELGQPVLDWWQSDGDGEDDTVKSPSPHPAN